MGRAIVRRFVQEGAQVVVADLQKDAAQAVAAELSGAIGVRVDVRNQNQVQTMVETAIREFGALDILVNNAGVGKIIPFLDTTEKDWDFMFDVNCKGLLWCSQAAAKVMIDQGRGGKIINLASQAGRRARPSCWRTAPARHVSSA
jgi:NAD(P)-dependent dehydrogenase (short-subunit alcohol dehydrogenase family)